MQLINKYFSKILIRYFCLAAAAILFANTTIAQNTDETIGISSAGDKIAIVQTTLNYFDNTINYSLISIDLKMKSIKSLVKFDEDSDMGINHPKWSPDGKWISFESYSSGGHSPLTTFRTWVVDSAGNELQKVELPGLFNNFSNYVVKWEGEKDLLIHGSQEIFKDNQSTTIEKDFMFNCETKKITNKK